VVKYQCFGALYCLHLVVDFWVIMPYIVVVGHEASEVFAAFT